MEQSKESGECKVGPSGKRSWIGLLLVIGVVGLAAVGGFGTRKRFGTWPLEARWKPILIKI